MAQMGLFSAGPLVLVDDARGRIAYTPGVVAAERARAWFDTAREGVAWHSERRMMYEHEVDVPRLFARFALDALGDDDVSRVLRDASSVASDAVGVRFNSVGLNYYRDGNDSVAPHNDKLHELVRGFPIALISLGSTRRMAIRAKEAPKRAFNVDLEPGSLLVMSYDTQLHYTHGIPKTRDAVGPRISLAFRVRPT